MYSAKIHRRNTKLLFGYGLPPLDRKKLALTSDNPSLYLQHNSQAVFFVYNSYGIYSMLQVYVFTR